MALEQGGGRRALVIGCAGQDGSYLSELLVRKGYVVTGVTRPSSDAKLSNLAGIRDQVDVRRVDLMDTPALSRILETCQPHEVYNFASVSFGPDAWTDPVRTTELGTVAVARLLEAVRVVAPQAKYFQASSAWVFGNPSDVPQRETTPLSPLEPYGAAKAFGNYLLNAYRERYGMYACSGIFYNHESPRRPAHFVTRKVTRAAAMISLGRQDQLLLGPLEARRDWGFAVDYVEAAWRMLQADQARDYVIATGVAHSVEQLVERAFDRVGLDWREYVRQDKAFSRPKGATVPDLLGDPSRARTLLGWRPTTSFGDLVDLMVESDLRELNER